MLCTTDAFLNPGIAEIVVIMLHLYSLIWYKNYGIRITLGELGYVRMLLFLHVFEHKIFEFCGLYKYM